MRNSSVIVVLGVVCLALSVTVAYLVGYQKGGQAMIAATQPGGSASQAGKRGTAGPADTSTPGQRVTFGMRARALHQSQTTSSVAGVQSAARGPTVEPISRLSGGTGSADHAAGVPGPVWVALGDAPVTLFETQSGTNILARVEGTGTLQDWEARSRIVVGRFQPGRDFPTNPARARPGPVDAQGEFIIPVRSLQLVQKDGSHLGSAMDSVVYAALLAQGYGTIRFTLGALTLTEAPKKGAPLRFDARGKLSVAGVEKEVVAPTSVDITGENIRFYGELNVNMSDFNIKPPAWPIADGTLSKADDKVKLSVDWTVRRTAR